MRIKLLATLMALIALGGRGWAQQVPAIDGLREKTAITEDDRRQIRQWVVANVGAMVGNTEPDRRGMVSARDAILSEVKAEGGRSAAFVQAVGDEVIAAIKDAEKKTLSQEARVNLMMTAAELKRLEAIPILQAALERDPYPASRYWAAKGLSMVAKVVLEKMATRSEAEISESIAKALDGEVSNVTFYHLIETLGQFDHDRAHDVLVDGISKVVTRLSVSDPVVAQLVNEAIRGLEKAYSREVRPDAKTRILSAYATLCVWVMPPMADSSLLANLNASLEKITGDKVGFVATDDPLAQKLAILEWVEKFVRDKRIPKRPAMPAAVEAALKEAKNEGDVGAAP